MSDQEMISRYNYNEFTAEKVMPWLNFKASPPLGQPAPDFPLWYSNGSQTSLSEIWSSHTYTVVEFGSYT